MQPENVVGLDFNVVEASSDFDDITSHYFDIEKRRSTIIGNHSAAIMITILGHLSIMTIRATKSLMYFAAIETLGIILCKAIRPAGYNYCRPYFFVL